MQITLFKYVSLYILTVVTVGAGNIFATSGPPLLPGPSTLSAGELGPLLEKWDKAVAGDRLGDKTKALAMVSHDVPASMRFRGSRVVRYDNREIRDRIVRLYLREIAKADGPPADKPSETNPWHDGEGEYLIHLMTVAESTFDAPIYEVELAPLGVQGELRLLYLASVDPERTLDYLLQSKRGVRGAKKGHPDYFYHGEIAWGMSVDDAYQLLSLMSLQSPDILTRRRAQVLGFVGDHLKHFASPRRVSYKPEPVYPKWQDYDVRNGALDVLELLGTVEDIPTIEGIIEKAPRVNAKGLTAGPRGRRDQIDQKAKRIIEQIQERAAKPQ